MPIPPIQKQLTQKLMQRYCESRIPVEVQDKIRLSYTIRGDHITLIESRPFWKDENRWIDTKIAQIRFENVDKTFTLYCADRNDKWHLYDYIDPTTDLEEVLAQIDADPTGIFWG